VLPDAISARRILTVAGLCLAIVGLRLIPSPPPAHADLCGTFPISVACGAANGIAGALSTVVDIGGKGVQIALNTTSGAISLGGKVVGKIGGAGCWIFDKTIGGGWKTKVCNAATSLVGKVTGLVSKAKGGATTSSAGGGSSGAAAAQGQEPADSPQSYLRTSAIAAGAAFFAGEIAHVVSRGTSADVTAPWYRQLYGRVAGFAVGVALLALLLALAEGATLGDGALVAAALRAVPYAALMTAAATSLVMLALRVVDAASSDIAGPNMREVTHVLHMAAVLFVGLGLVAKASSVAAAHGGVLAHLGVIAKLAAFPAAMFAIFGAIATAAVAAELVLREVAIYASVLFLPLILAARIWPRLRHAGERLGRVLGAVIVSKLVLVVVLAMLAGAILHGGLSGLAVGIAGLFAVAVAPAMFYGLFVLAEHGFTRGALPVPAPMSAADRMAEVVGWHTARVNEVRGVAYAPAIAATGPSPSAPPPAPPTPPPAAPPAPPTSASGGGGSATPRPAAEEEVGGGEE
jgi:hypothetical protein